MQTMTGFVVYDKEGEKDYLSNVGDIVIPLERFWYENGIQH